MAAGRSSARDSFPCMPNPTSAAITAAGYLSHLDRESRRFAEVLAGVDPAVPVPTCPGWSAADLLWHLTEVQWFWGSIASGRITDGAAVEAADEDKPARPEQYREMLDLCDAARERLAAALADGPDDTPLWSWAADQTLRFVRRRQAHEALIHRVDAELSAGLPAGRSPGPLDQDLAADGIDELLTVMWAEMPSWASFTATEGVVDLAASDTGDRWRLALGRMTGRSPRSGKSYDEPAVAMLDPGSGEPDALVRGSAGDLDRWLWNRGAGAEITRSGSDGALDGLAGLIAAGIQ